MDAAHALVDTSWLPPAIFAVISLALILFGLWLAAWATVDTTYLRTLAYVLAVLSVAFAAALAYETLALATHRFPTISAVTHAAFERHTLWWVAIFGGLLLAVGVFGTAYTRLARPGTALHVVRLWFANTRAPVAWAALLGLGIVGASLLVTRFPPPLGHSSNGDPGFSWWVLYMGGAAFGSGVLLVWALDIGPDWTPARSSRSAATAARLVRSRRASIAVFVLAAAALFGFALVMVAWGMIHGSYLAPLCYVLATISAAFAIALAYQVVAVWRGGAYTISNIVDGAFTTHQLIWVAIFGAVLFGIGLLATHFTRKASVLSALVSTERTVTSLTEPLVWAVVLGVVMVALATVVGRGSPLRTAGAKGISAISWWVLYTGGTAYAVGALVAWATNWAP